MEQLRLVVPIVFLAWSLGWFMGHRRGQRDLEWMKKRADFWYRQHINCK